MDEDQEVTLYTQKFRAQPYSYTGSRVEFLPINPDEPDVLLVSSTPTREQLARTTPAATRDELARIIVEAGAVGHPEDTGRIAPYKLLNTILNRQKDNPMFQSVGVLLVNVHSTFGAQLDHAVFFREHGRKVYIFDANDWIGRRGFAYDARYFTGIIDWKRPDDWQVRPLLRRKFSFNDGYGSGVCFALSFAMSRIWGVLLKKEMSRTRPKGADKDRINALSTATFERVNEQFTRILVHPAVNTRLLLRMAFGTPEVYKEIWELKRELPKMARAVAMLETIIDEFDAQERAAEEAHAAGAGGGAGAGSRKRGHSEVE